MVHLHSEHLANLHGEMIRHTHTEEEEEEEAYRSSPLSDIVISPLAQREEDLPASRVQR